jgi:hypothetical protein
MRRPVSKRSTAAITPSTEPFRLGPQSAQLVTCIRVTCPRGEHAAAACCCHMSLTTYSILVACAEKGKRPKGISRRAEGLRLTSLFIGWRSRCSFATPSSARRVSDKPRSITTSKHPTSSGASGGRLSLSMGVRPQPWPGRTRGHPDSTDDPLSARRRVWARPGRAAGSRPHPIRAAGTGERGELIKRIHQYFPDNAENASPIDRFCQN